jgi:hypothetical protein
LDGSVRALFSLRFVAAVLAVIASFVVVAQITDDSEAAVVDATEASDFVRRIDLVTPVERFMPSGFSVVDGVAASTVGLVIDDRRSMAIVEGTPGIDRCSTILRRVGDCVIFADLLGEAVVWFEIAPLASDGKHVVMPAVIGFDGDRALLDNQMLLPHAEVFTRRCDTEYASFVEMLNDRGTAMASWWSIVEGAITDVVCTD